MAPPRVIACVSSAEVRHLAPYLLARGDRVVEIGSSLGAVTAALRDLVGAGGGGGGGAVLAFDKARKMARGGRHADAFRNTSEMPGVEFSELAGSCTAADICASVLQHLVAPASSSSFSGGVQAVKAIFLDTSSLSGLDLFLDFVQLVRLIAALLGPVTGARYIVVKSKVLRQCSRRYFGATRLCQKGAAPALLGRFRRELALASSERHMKAGWRDPGPIVLGTRRVHEYRQAAVLCVRPGDDVLEIGCHCGKTTALLMESQVGARLAIGVDIGPKIVKEAQKRYPHCKFRTADAWDTRTLLELANEFCAQPQPIEEQEEAAAAAAAAAESSTSAFRSSFDVILIDVGGLSSDSGLMEALALIRQLSHAFRPRLRAIVIKSACVRSFCGELTPAVAFIEAVESRQRARAAGEKDDSANVSTNVATN
jgi:protein-L-isoaspartate O-methyltransferase